jgi:hypothetical protein
VDIAVRCDDNGDHKFLFITAKAGLGPEQTAGCALFTDAGLKKYQEFILAPLRIKIYCHSAVILIEALKKYQRKTYRHTGYASQSKAHRKP